MSRENDSGTALVAQVVAESTRLSVLHAGAEHLRTRLSQTPLIVGYRFLFRNQFSQVEISGYCLASVSSERKPKVQLPHSAPSENPAT